MSVQSCHWHSFSALHLPRASEENAFICRKRAAPEVSRRHSRWYLTSTEVLLSICWLRLIARFNKTWRSHTRVQGRLDEVLSWAYAWMSGFLQVNISISSDRLFIISFRAETFWWGTWMRRLKISSPRTSRSTGHWKRSIELRCRASWSAISLSLTCVDVLLCKGLGFDSSYIIHIQPSLWSEFWTPIWLCSRLSIHSLVIRSPLRPEGPRRWGQFP